MAMLLFKGRAGFMAGARDGRIALATGTHIGFFDANACRFEPRVEVHQVNRLALADGAPLVVAASATDAAGVWDLDSRRRVVEIGSPLTVNAVAWDGADALLGGWDRSLRPWERRLRLVRLGPDGRERSRVVPGEPLSEMFAVAAGPGWVAVAGLAGGAILDGDGRTRFALDVDVVGSALAAVGASRVSCSDVVVAGDHAWFGLHTDVTVEDLPALWSWSAEDGVGAPIVLPACEARPVAADPSGRRLLVAAHVETSRQGSFYQERFDTELFVVDIASRRVERRGRVEYTHQGGALLADGRALVATQQGVWQL